MNAGSANTVYKVLQLVASAVGAMIAGAIFTRLWSRFDTTQDAPPQAQDLTQSTSRVMVAAAGQGALFAVVRALIDRLGAHGYQRMVGVQPPL
jgi:hypothetical protein